MLFCPLYPVPHNRDKPGLFIFFPGIHLAVFKQIGLFVCPDTGRIITAFVKYIPGCEELFILLFFFICFQLEVGAGVNQDCGGTVLVFGEFNLA